jgi:hypothetical protein
VILAASHGPAITQLQIDELRAGRVKARRPRACAVEAKRRALHASHILPTTLKK